MKSPKSELHFIWIVSCSESMNKNGKINSLNDGISHLIPIIKKVTGENPHAQLIMKVIRFSDRANVHISDTPIEDFEWKNLRTSGKNRDLEAALDLVTDSLKIPPIPVKAFPPFLVLIMDSAPTDNFIIGYEKLFNIRQGKKAIKIAISIGEDADEIVLKRFICNSEITPFIAHKGANLVNYIKWITMNAYDFLKPLKGNEEKERIDQLL